MGNYIALFAALFMVWFINAEYKNAVYVKEHGYSAEYRARLDDIIAGIEPLFVADLGDVE